MLNLFCRYCGSIRVAFILLLIHMIVSALIFQLGWVPQLKNLAAGQDILDNRPGFEAAMLYETLETYGEEGRSIYGDYLVFIDSPYALLTGLVFTAFAASISRQRKVAWDLLYLLPACIVLLDIVENIALLWVLDKYPQEVPLANCLGQLTALKMFAVTTGILLVLFALILGSIRWLNGRRSN